jgi:predicted adenylyl cyclase CyaB
MRRTPGHLAPDSLMARNIEIKARVASIYALVPRVSAIADRGPVEIDQDDTFFLCATGRLKLRMLSEGSGELIFYRRDDTLGPKESFYVRAATNSPESLREVLSLAYGLAGRVRKHRTLYQCGRTRIHLDRIEGLGEFLELEVVLQDGESANAGVQEAERLLERLGITADQLIPDAYVDLIVRGDGH